MVIYIFGLIGCSVFAFSGALAAGRKGLDWFGVLVLAGVTAIGGGTLRDVLLNRDQIFWISDTSYLWVILGTTVATIIYGTWFKAPHGALRVADALGLPCSPFLAPRWLKLAVPSPLLLLPWA